MPDERLIPARRVKSRKDFLRVQKEGRKVRSEHFLLAHCSRVPSEQESRIGVTITTKIDKRAARRNRLRRRVRDIFRKHHSRLLGAHDIVVIALTGAVDLAYDEVKHEILSSFRKARLLPDRPREARVNRPGNG